jgi:hypothetical protein
MRNTDIQVDSFLDLKQRLLWKLRENDRNMERLIRPRPLGVASAFRESSGSEEFQVLQIRSRDVEDEPLTRV